MPVEQMPLIPLQAADCRHGIGQPLYYLVEGQVTAIISAQYAGHPEADIGRTGPHGQAILIGKLVIVRRQPGGMVADEGREKVPGSPGNLSEQSAVRRRQRIGVLLLDGTLI